MPVDKTLLGSISALTLCSAWILLGGTAGGSFGLSLMEFSSPVVMARSIITILPGLA